jgi:hypothetical protein
MMLVLQPVADLGLWAVGMIPGLVGVALLICARLIRPRTAGPTPGS